MYDPFISKMLRCGPCVTRRSQVTTIAALNDDDNVADSLTVIYRYYFPRQRQLVPSKHRISSSDTDTSSDSSTVNAGDSVA